MKSGPLKDRRIALTGRTDPRGSENYNEKLGLERAERVKRYLVANGIDSARIETRSLGKTDASPAPQDWAADRRVEIELAP
jgi:peptidoglycan-associated lipoprotein